MIRKGFSLTLSSALRVLQVHNEYYSGFGGEDTVAGLEADLLRRNGHDVERLIVSTTELKGAGPLRMASAALGAVWSVRGYSVLKKAVAAFSPDVIHVHNPFPLLSPSIFWAAKDAGVPIVQTLHNFRITCANALLFRDGKSCQQCVGRFPWPALQHRCYRGSMAQTAIVACMNVVHRWIGTFTSRVDAYIVLAEFSKEIALRSGLPEEKVFVKPNFVVKQAEISRQRKPQAIFVGRLYREKGVHLLLDAWKMAQSAGRIPADGRLIVMGDGPERSSLEQQYRSDSGIVWCGVQPPDRVMEAVATSRMLAIPSLCYENCPMVVLEAFSAGTPVIAPDHGPFPAMVSHQKNGLLFTPGDIPTLADALAIGMSAEENTWLDWSEAARTKYLADYTEQLGYERLITIYKQAIARRAD